MPSERRRVVGCNNPAVKEGVRLCPHASFVNDGVLSLVCGIMCVRVCMYVRVCKVHAYLVSFEILYQLGFRKDGS